MITLFKIFEEQLKLFDYPPTDTEISNSFISKYKTKKPYNLNTSLTLRDGLESVDRDEINQLIYNYFEKHEIEDYEWNELLYGNEDEFIEFAREWNESHPDGIEKSLDDIDTYYYRQMDSYLGGDRNEALSALKEYLLNKYKDNFIKYVETEYYEDLKSAIYKSPYSNKLFVYRSVTLPSQINRVLKPDEGEYSGVGTYWTYDEDKAEAYWRKHDREFILEGWVYSNGIDWINTVNCCFYELREEREISIKQGTPIQITKVVMKTIQDDWRFVENKEIEKLKKMFGLNDEQIFQHLENKYKNISQLTLDEPVWVIA